MPRYPMVSMGRPSSRPGPLPAGRSPGSWAKTKPWPSPRGFSTTNRERPRCDSERSGSVRASSISTSARAAKVHQVLTPLIEPPPFGRGGRSDDAGDVRTEVGLGDRHGRQHLGRGQLGQPLLLLLLGAAVDQGPGEDLGPGDQGAADAERPPAQLLGGDDHAHVVALPAGGEAVVVLGDGQPEAAQFGQAGDDLLGDVAVGAVDVLGVRAHLLLGETVERLADELEVTPRWRGPSTPARAARAAGSRRAAKKSAAGALQPASTPQSASRPATRPIRSATTSATKAVARSSSVSPRAP